MTRQGATCFLCRLGFALTLEKNYMQNASEPPRQGPYNPPLWSFITRSVIVTDFFLIQSKEEGTHQVKRLRTGVNISCTQIWLRLKRPPCACMSAQSCLTLCDPLDCSPPGFSVHGISQARLLEWVAISFSRRSSQPGIKPVSPALQKDSLPLSHLGSCF